VIHQAFGERGGVRGEAGGVGLVEEHDHGQAVFEPEVEQLLGSRRLVGSLTRERRDPGVEQLIVAACQVRRYDRVEQRFLGGVVPVQVGRGGPGGRGDLGH
jgi:hypothetical protein